MVMGMFLRTCGSRDDLEDAFSDSEIVQCPDCLLPPASDLITGR
jgi:hypothetical protein